MWNTENEHALHLLENTIGDAELIHVVGAETAAQAWKQLAEVKEPRGLTTIVNTTWKLRSEEHTSELQSHSDLVCRLLLEKKKTLTFKKFESLSVNHCHLRA